MKNLNVIATILGLGLAIVLICKLSAGTKTREGYFTMTPMTYVVQPSAKAKDGQLVGLGSSVLYNSEEQSRKGPGKGEFFQAGPHFQANLSPRMMPGDYGANIRYNLPSRENLAVPCHPLTFGNMVNKTGTCDSKEGFCGSCAGGCGTTSCGKGGANPSDKAVRSPNLPPPNYSASGFNEAQGKLQYTEVTDMLPMGDMTTMGDPATGEATQTINYQNFMYANQRSRYVQHGDWFRGDLAITPCETGWFRPSVHPNIDLRQGALAVMGGIDNETSKDLFNLQNASVGGTLQSFAGVSSSTLIPPGQKTVTTYGTPIPDVTVTSYP